MRIKFREVKKKSLEMEIEYYMLEDKGRNQI